MHRYDLLVVGSANADLVVRVARRPGAGETVLGSDLAVHPGGKGANQAVAAARLGARTALLARVGDDAYGELLAGSLRGAGADTAGVLVGGAPTGVALITVEPSGENSIVVSPGANARLTPGDIAAADGLFAAARVVSLQLEIPLETVAAAVAAAGAAGARVVLNPSPPAELPPAVLAACDPLVLNEHEARLLLGAEAAEDAEAAPAASPEAYASALRALGPRSVVITLGASGALLLDESGALTIPGVPVTAVDTTGAGDAFTAALAHRLAAGDPLPAAAAYATRVAALSVTRPGAQSSYPTAAEAAELGRNLG